MTSDHRRAARLVVNSPALAEPIGQLPLTLHPSLARVYRRVEADTSRLGERFPVVVRDLSTNGAFVAGPALPLLSRVALKFEVRGIGAIDVVGWVMWLRTDDCEVPGNDGPVVLPRGFGLLFEAISLDARTQIAALVAAQ